MGIKVLYFEKTLSRDEMMYQGGDRFMQHFLEDAKHRAGRAFGEMIIREGSRHQRFEMPDQPGWRWRWSVGVETEMRDVLAREIQIEEARLQGRREAAEILRSILRSNLQLTATARNALEITASRIDEGSQDGTSADQFRYDGMHRLVGVDYSNVSYTPPTLIEGMGDDRVP